MRGYQEIKISSMKTYQTIKATIKDYGYPDLPDLIIDVTATIVDNRVVSLKTRDGRRQSDVG